MASQSGYGPEGGYRHELAGDAFRRTGRAVAARPGEFLGGQLGAECDGGVDGHAMLSFREYGGAVARYRSAAFGGFGQFVVDGVTVIGVEDVEDCQISEGHRGADRCPRPGVRVSHDG